MTYDTYRIIFYSGIGLAVAGLLVSITLFIVLNIPAVIGELTGRTERKAIESIRNRNVNAQDNKGFDLGKSRKLAGPSRKLGKEANTGGTGKTRCNPPSRQSAGLFSRSITATKRRFSVPKPRRNAWKTARSPTSSKRVQTILPRISGKNWIGCRSIWNRDRSCIFPAVDS